MSEIDISKLDECLDIIKDGDWEFGDKTLSKAAKAELTALRSEIERLKAENNNIYNSHERILKADDVIRAAEFAQLNNLYIKTFRMLEECEENLVGMVEQYCRYNSDANRFGHDFMSAGESTFEYLVKHGLAEYTENGVDIKLIPQPPEEK